MPEDVPELLAAHQGGNISLGHYRGRCCYSRPVQAAEYFVRRESGVLGIEALRLLESHLVETDWWRVRFTNTSDETLHEVDVRSLARTEVALMTCRSNTAEKVREFKLESYRQQRA
jgi:hypothetical protein